MTGAAAETPGVPSRMDPMPDCGEESYVGAGRFRVIGGRVSGRL